MDGLDEMSESTFNDKCTGANPIHPLNSEIRKLSFRAYWGKDYNTKVKEGISTAKPQLFSNPFGSGYQMEMHRTELPLPAAAPAPEKNPGGKE